MAKPISVEEIQILLEPHATRLSRSIWPAWGRYAKLLETDRLAFDLTAEATVINRFIVEQVKREFSGAPGVHMSEECGFILGIEGFPVGIDGMVACRFKKLNEIGQSNSYPTQRAKAIKRNETDDLDGIPPSATMVDVGYVLNEYRTNFVEVQAVRIVGTKFVMNFPEVASAGITMPLTLIHSPVSRFEIVASGKKDNVAGTEK